MKTNANVPNCPRAGVWGDENVYRSYVELYNSLHNLLSSDNNVPSLQITGTKQRIKAQVNEVELKLKIFKHFVNATAF
jgi:hypothetical protein